MNAPNVIFLIWDAGRYDAALNHAPTLESLAAENVSFENAIAPAPWTLPSHVSLFTGSYPHEHAVTRPGQTPRSYPLLEDVGEQYTTYGVSGNPFFSHHTDAHEFFDHFYYTTPTVFADGINVAELDSMGESSDLEGRKLQKLLQLLQKSFNHEHPLKSLLNIASVMAFPRVRENRFLNRIPHPRFNEHEIFSYSPERNTRHVERIVRSEADADEPFFLFANYMDTHRPYAPPAAYQRRHLGRKLSYRELCRIDETVADTWTHLERLQRGDVTETELETLRRLYAGTVDSVDEHLKAILDVLDETGARDDTLVVVTADHGEALGEEDEMGNRRVGHQMTVADDVLRVPLVVARPDLEPAQITERVSIKDLYEVLTGDIGSSLAPAQIADAMVPSDRVVVSEYPAKGLTSAYEDHPDIPRDILRAEVSEHSVVAYYEEWKLVVTSAGTSWAGKAGNGRPPERAPERLHETCERHLKELADDGQRTRVDSTPTSQLKNLGYL